MTLTAIIHAALPLGYMLVLPAMAILVMCEGLALTKPIITRID